MRLIALAIAAFTFLTFGLVSLQFQVEKTGSDLNVSGNMTGNPAAAYNTSEAVLSNFTNTLGVGMPGFFLAAIVAFAAVLLWMGLQQ